MAEKMLQKWSPLSLLEDEEHFSNWPMNWSTNWPINFPFKSFQAPGADLSVYEQNDHVIVEAPLAGFQPDNTEITFEKGVLTIRANKKETEQDKKKKFWRKANQQFLCQLRVPGNVNANAEPQANFKDGVLRVSFQKQKKAQPKRIQVKKG